MNDYKMLRKALVLAYHAHKGQKAKDRELPEYIFHPVTVALQCTTAKEKTAALLHDVIEDTDITAEDLQTGLLVLLEERRTGKADEESIGNNRLHCLVELAGLCAVALVHKHRNVAFC